MSGMRDTTVPSTHFTPAMPSRRRHLVDATMYWSPVGGGVSRYLHTKRAWIDQRGGGWRHSWVVSGPCEGPGRNIGGLRLPASGGYRFPLQRRRAARVLAELAPDVIESGDPFRLAWSTLDAAQSLGIPSVAFCHTNLAAEARRWLGSAGLRASRRYLRHLLREFDLVLAASRWMQAELDELGLDNVALQPLGVDLARFHPALRDPAWAESLGIPRGTTVLLYAGRFAPEKNLGVLCDLVDRLGDGYVLVAQGAGPCPPAGPRVRMLPYANRVEAVARAMASADIFVHAGDHETFGLAPLEALACGTPVVVPALGGLSDLADGHAALGAIDATASALADAVHSLQQQDAAALRTAARQRALAFDQQRMFAQQFGRYAQLCEGTAPAIAVRPR